MMLTSCSCRAGPSQPASSAPEQPKGPQRQRSTPRLARLFGYHTTKDKDKGKSKLAAAEVSVCSLSTR